MVAYMVNPEFIVDLYETPNSAYTWHSWIYMYYYRFLLIQAC